MKDILERIAKLSPVQRELLVRRSRVSQADSLPPAPALLQRKPGASVPLSCLQEQLWLYEQFAPESLAYHIRLAYRLKGPLNENALQTAISEIVQRHEALRAFFPMAGGSPVQEFAEAAAGRLPVEQITPGTPLGMEAQAQHVSSATLNQPFDLGQGPLYRFLLVRLREDDYVIAFAFHHMIFDGWSCEIFLRELSGAYNAFLARSKPDLPNLPVHYGDFALWQREWLQFNGMEQQLSFWKDRLAGAPLLLDLSTDKPRPAVCSDDGQVETGMLSPDVSRALRDLARSEGVSLFVLLMTAFAVVLYRYCDQDDILIGTPVVGRTRNDVENLIG